MTVGDKRRQFRDKIGNKKGDIGFRAFKSQYRLQAVANHQLLGVTKL